MTDDIVTRLREWVVVPVNAFLDEDIKEAADEIERLRALCDQLAEALRIQCEFHQVPVATTSWYSQHAKDSLAQYEERRGR